MITEGLTINVYIDGKKARPETPMPKPAEVKKESEGADLGLRMMARDTLDEEQEAKLINEIVLFVRKLLEQKKLSTLKNFLHDNKNYLPTEARDMIAEEVRLKDG